MGISRKENGSLVKKAGKTLVDLALSLTSHHAIANSVVTQEINQLNTSLSELEERINKMGMKVLKYGTISATTTIQLGVTLDPSKYMVNINTNGYRSGNNSTNNPNDATTTTWTWTDYGQGAYLSAKTSTSCTIAVSSGITASYEIIQIAE